MPSPAKKPRRGGTGSGADPVIGQPVQQGESPARRSSGPDVIPGSPENGHVARSKVISVSVPQEDFEWVALAAKKLRQHGLPDSFRSVFFQHGIREVRRQVGDLEKMEPSELADRVFKMRRELAAPRR